VAFFLEGGAALYTGRGDVLARRLPSLEAPIVLVKPEEPVPTAAAYAAFDALAGAGETAAGQPSAEPLIAALEAGDVRVAATLLHNAMTVSSATLVPAIGDALALVRGCPGVLGAAMAGSGSAVFGVCSSDATAEACADRARSTGFWAVATRAHSGGCVIERA
jgi:4-diphosphocytidyl-2-C-methyl-D-erythritol kinase